MLESQETAKHDLPSSVIDPLVREGRVFAYPMESDWNYVPDLRSYIRYHDRLLRGEKRLHPEEQHVTTNLQDRDLGSRPSPYFGRLSNVRESLISPGCVVEGTVIRSVLSPGVYVAPRARVENCILFHDCQVHEGVVLHGVVSDKDVEFEPFCRVGEEGLDLSDPDLRKLTLVGKGAHFIQGVQVGAGKEIQINQVVHRDWKTYHDETSTVA